mgnify:CR=1 FL=1
MKAKNVTPTILVRLKGTGSTRVYQPGDTIEGHVEITPETDINCRHIEIKIGWQTEGKGTRYESFPYVNMINVTSVGPMNPLVEHFDFVIPSEPWSYSGFYVSIVWLVQVKIDIAMGRDYNHTANFVVQPT